MFFLYFTFISAYWAFMIYTIGGWRRLKKMPLTQLPSKTRVSVVVPFRNEINSLRSLIQSLEIQSYPRNLFEVILVDDHSEDEGMNLLNQLKSSVSFELIILSLPEDRMQKKAAISMAVEHAQGELIVTTDCDTSRSSEWISSIAAHFETHVSDLIIAPVMMKAEKNFLEQFQAIEFLSLQWVTAGFAGQQNAILCNGANLIFRKEVFMETKAYQGTPDIASGDDFFFLFKLKKQRHRKITYVLDHKAVVTTRAEHSWKEFSQQRLRWASKSRFAYDQSFYMTGIYNTLLSFFLILLPFLELNHRSFPMYSCFFLGMKFFGDWFLLKKMALFFRVKPSIKAYLLSFILYPFYICHTFILTLVKKPVWKGRSLT